MAIPCAHSKEVRESRTANYAEKFIYTSFSIGSTTSEKHTLLPFKVKQDHARYNGYCTKDKGDS